MTATRIATMGGMLAAVAVLGLSVQPAQAWVGVSVNVGGGSCYVPTPRHTYYQSYSSSPFYPGCRSSFVYRRTTPFTPTYRTHSYRSYTPVYHSYGHSRRVIYRSPSYSHCSRRVVYRSPSRHYHSRRVYVAPRTSSYRHHGHHVSRRVYRGPRSHHAYRSHGRSCRPIIVKFDD